MCLLGAYISTHNFDILCLSEVYLDSSITSTSNDINLAIPSYDLYTWRRVVSTINFSSVESNRHSRPTRVHQLRIENRRKLM